MQPKANAVFWFMTVIAMTLASAGGDGLFMRVDFDYLMITRFFYAVLAASLVLQFIPRTKNSLSYWLAALATSIAGPMLFDLMDSSLWIGHAEEAGILSGLLFVCIAAWKLTARRAQAFFWLAVIVANVLGTLIGSMLSERPALGLSGALLVATGGVLVLTALACSRWISRTLLFWSAFLLTRPLGTFLGDLLTKTDEQGGFALNRIYTSLALLAVLLLVIVGSSLEWGGKRKAREAELPLAV